MSLWLHSAGLGVLRKDSKVAPLQTVRLLSFGPWQPQRGAVPMHGPMPFLTSIQQDAGGVWALITPT